MDELSQAITKILNIISEMTIYKIREEIHIIPNKIRIDVWITKPNGESHMVELEMKMDNPELYEEAFRERDSPDS